MHEAGGDGNGRVARVELPRALLALTLGAALTGCAEDPPERVPPGVWGGVGLVLTVGSTGAEAEFDCATGTVTEPLLLDAAGRFAVAGTVTLGHGGPDHEGDVPDVRRAAYRGRLSDDVLTLLISIENVATSGEPFVLRWNDPGLLHRCL